MSQDVDFGGIGQSRSYSSDHSKYDGKVSRSFFRRKDSLKTTLGLDLVGAYLSIIASTSQSLYRGERSTTWFPERVRAIASPV